MASLNTTCSLLREEQEELDRSKNKVKDVSHSSFRGGQESGPSSPILGFGQWQQPVSQAFNFGEPMEDEDESDKEVEALWEGCAAVKFSKDFKQHIRRPWAKALIVKVYGRSVGFNFLQPRLLSLWKPKGRMDCVALGHGFFLTRFSLKEDYESVLERGPWFIRSSSSHSGLGSRTPDLLQRMFLQ